MPGVGAADAERAAPASYCGKPGTRVHHKKTLRSHETQHFSSFPFSVILFFFLLARNQASSIIIERCHHVQNAGVLFEVCRFLRAVSKTRYDEGIVHFVLHLLRNNKTSRILGVAATVIWEITLTHPQNITRLVRSTATTKQNKTKKEIERMGGGWRKKE